MTLTKVTKTLWVNGDGEEFTQEDMFKYLVNLRDSGVLNMLLAPKWLANAFDLSQEDATRVFWEWANSLQEISDFCGLSASAISRIFLKNGTKKGT